MSCNILGQAIDVLCQDWVIDFLGKYSPLPSGLDFSFAPTDVISLTPERLPAAPVPDIQHVSVLPLTGGSRGNLSFQLVMDRRPLAQKVEFGNCNVGRNPGFAVTRTR